MQVTSQHKHGILRALYGIAMGANATIQSAMAAHHGGARGELSV